MLIFYYFVSCEHKFFSGPNGLLYPPPPPVSHSTPTGGLPNEHSTDPITQFKSILMNTSGLITFLAIEISDHFK